jgi:hypothetical protein
MYDDQHNGKDLLADKGSSLATQGVAWKIWRYVHEEGPACGGRDSGWIDGAPLCVRERVQ